MNSFLNDAVHTFSLMGCLLAVIGLVSLMAIRLLKSDQFRPRQNLIFGAAASFIFSTIVIGFFIF